MSDPNTFWLNVTNIGLGVVTLACILVVMRAVLQEVTAKAKERARQLVEDDDHMFREPVLGLTMADGGVRVDRSSEKVYSGLPADKVEPNIYRSVN